MSTFSVPASAAVVKHGTLTVSNVSVVSFDGTNIVVALVPLPETPPVAPPPKATRAPKTAPVAPPIPAPAATPAKAKGVARPAKAAIEVELPTEVVTAADPEVVEL